MSWLFYISITLISGHDFAGNVVGVAFVNGMCHGTMYGQLVVQSGSRYKNLIAATIAHEVGHTLGMLHDDERRSENQTTSSSIVFTLFVAY